MKKPNFSRRKGKIFVKAAALSLTLAAAACGFRPIYATPSDADGPLVNRQIAVTTVTAPEDTHLFVLNALRDRIALGENQTPKFELSVIANESAQRLAVQIDATVTRYNYRLGGAYRLLDLTTGHVISGNVRAITSYNIVRSQYSTFFAEQTAREKAATILAEEIERDILLRMSNPGVDVEEAAKFLEAAEGVITIEEIDQSHNVRTGGEEPFIIEQDN